MMRHHHTRTLLATLLAGTAATAACTTTGTGTRTDDGTTARRDSAGAMSGGATGTSTTTGTTTGGAPGTSSTSGGMSSGASGSGMSIGGGQPGEGLLAKVDSVNAAARAGLTTLSPAQAVPLIQSIESQLATTNDDALRSIAGDLAELRTALQGGTPSRTSLSLVLARLGPKVTALSARGGAMAETFQSLGGQLSSAATQLGRAP